MQKVQGGGKREERLRNASKTVVKDREEREKG